MIALAKNSPFHGAKTSEKPIPRFLQLAHKIHDTFTRQEEKEKAAKHAAETAAQRKNAVIMQAVQEVTDFCYILTQTPGLKETFGTHAEDIAERTLGNRYAYTLDAELISVRYEVPVFYVDMKASDGTVLKNSDNAYLYVGFSPVKIAPSPEKPLDVPTLTTHTFFGRKYQIEVDGRITEDKKEADPVFDILTELRRHMGHEYFEDVLLPHLEAQSPRCA